MRSHLGLIALVLAVLPSCLEFPASPSMEPPENPSTAIRAIPQQELIVRVLDVGEGDATLITNGSSIVLVDGGKSLARLGVLLDSLMLNGSTIEAVILSHPHLDHFDALRELFKSKRRISVRYFFDNQDSSPYAPGTYSDNALRQVRDSVKARAARGELEYRDTDDPCGDGAPLCTLYLDGGAKLHILRPDLNGRTVNDRSAPVKLVGPDSASFTMWLAGDAEHPEINWFDTGAEYDAFPGTKVNVLKAQHHGSCDGLTSRYLEMTQPDFIAVSLHRTNSLGYIHLQTKDLLTRFGIPWYRTDQNGTITITSPGTPGGGYVVETGRGVANMDAPSDALSTQRRCNPLK